MVTSRLLVPGGLLSNQTVFTVCRESLIVGAAGDLTWCGGIGELESDSDIQVLQAGNAVFADSDVLQVLIADDDHAFRGTLSEMFRPACSTLEACSGEEALEIASVERVDLVLLDMHMQVLTGLETLRELKFMHAKTPCILITAEADDELVREATALQAFSVLPKPLRRRELFRTVAEALRASYPQLVLPGIF